MSCVSAAGERTVVFDVGSNVNLEINFGTAVFNFGMAGLNLGMAGFHFGMAGF